MPTYINKTGTSNKFWGYEISKDGKTVTVSWGRVGTRGDSQSETFGSIDGADSFVQSKIREKTRKGYRLLDVAEVKKEEKLAKTIGFQHKVQRVEYVDLRENDKKLRRLTSYDQSKGIYVEVINSWSKDSVFLYLDADKSVVLEGIAEDKSIRLIEFERSVIPTGQRMDFARGVREYLRELAAQVKAVVKRGFAALGTRAIDEDAVIDSGSSFSLDDVLAEVGESGASRQVVTKFAGLGSRTLLL